MGLTRKEKTRLVGVTGGKGGTGKTTIAVNLAVQLAQMGFKVLLIDCDVDAPNTHILMNCKLHTEEEVKIFLPKVDENLCVHCGECVKACRAHALMQVEDKPPILFPDLCNGCEACRIACPQKAILEDWKIVGWTYKAEAYNVDLIVGKLKLGEAESSVVVRGVRKRAQKLIEKENYDIAIIDTAPGAHCDVMRALYGVDYALAVTEPTLFGEYDLNLILKLTKEMGLNVSVVLNRANMTKEKKIIYDVCENHGVKIVSEIPLDETLLKCYVSGVPVVIQNPDSRVARIFKSLADFVIEVAGI